jgi:hypothetical protein
MPTELIGGNRRFMVIRREDGRIGFYDTIGVWHTGLPVPDWGDFLRDAGLEPRLIPAALAVLGVRADWSCARHYPNDALRIPHEPVVYYASCPGGLIKIGTTKHLQSRWAAYKSKYKSDARFRPDRLLAVEAGDSAVEAAVRRGFQNLRLHSRSEYLNPSPALDAWISERAAWLRPGPGH